MPQPTVRRGPVRQVITRDPVPRDSSWEECVSAYLVACRAKNLTAATLENYGQYLRGKRTLLFLTDHEITSPAEMTAGLLRTLEGELLEADVASGTVDTFHRIIKTFLRFCHEEGYGGDEKVWTGGKKGHGVEGPKLEQREPDKFTDAEIAKMRAALKNRPRDLMLVDLLLATGLRLQEVTNLTLDDLDLDGPAEPLISVRQGKGRKDRRIPIDTPKNKVSDALRRYIAKVRPKGATSRALFLTNRGDASGAPQPLTAPAIQTIFKRLSRDLGHPGATGIHVHPHKFRHTFATRSLSAGLDIVKLQKVLGHSTLAMVSRYLHYDTDDLVAAYRLRRD